MACAVLVRALKDASRKDWPSEQSYEGRADKCTPADKASAQFFLYRDADSLRFWVTMAGIRWLSFKDFLSNNKLDSDEVRSKLKLGAWDKIIRVRKGYKQSEGE